MRIALFASSLVLLIGCAASIKDPETIERVNRLEARITGVETRVEGAASAAATKADVPASEPTPGDETSRRIERVREGIEALESADRARRRGDAKVASTEFRRAQELAPEAVSPFARMFGIEGSTATPPLTPTPPPTPEPGKATLSGSVKVTGPHADPALATIVAVRPLSGSLRSRRAGTYSMRQFGKTFEPHVLAIPVGSKVSFPNQDSFFHNVFSVSPDKKFDLGVFSTGKSDDVVFDKPAVVQILCNLHAYMTGFVVVLEDPYFTIAENGQFTIRDIAPGRYRVWVWNERSRSGAQVTADLKAGPNKIDFTVTADQEPKVPPDKNGKPRQAYSR